MLNDTWYGPGVSSVCVFVGFRGCDSGLGFGFRGCVGAQLEVWKSNSFPVVRRFDPGFCPGILGCSSDSATLRYGVVFC